MGTIKCMTKKFFCGFEPAKMHWAFFKVTNAFQDESWDLSNSKSYEFDCKRQHLSKTQQVFSSVLVYANSVIKFILFYFNTIYYCIDSDKKLRKLKYIYSCFI